MSITLLWNIAIYDDVSLRQRCLYPNQELERNGSSATDKLKHIILRKHTNV